MRLFYDPDISYDDTIFTLNEEESKHISRVLRMKVGDSIGILNGKGERFTGEIINSGKRCEIRIAEREKSAEDNCHIHIAIAPTKNNDRIEWFVEKATEIGINEISLITSENSERSRIKPERLYKKAISAMKQSGRWDLPTINDLCSFKEFIGKHPAGLLAHCYDEQKAEISEVFRPADCPILIGPEGDFSLEEVKLALNSGYNSVSLGKNRLRTETAALFACMQAKILCE